MPVTAPLSAHAAPFPATNRHDQLFDCTATPLRLRSGTVFRECSSLCFPRTNLTETVVYRNAHNQYFGYFIFGNLHPGSRGRREENKSSNSEHSVIAPAGCVQQGVRSVPPAFKNDDAVCQSCRNALSSQSQHLPFHFHGRGSHAYGQTGLPVSDRTSNRPGTSLHVLFSAL